MNQDVPCLGLPYAGMLNLLVSNKLEKLFVVYVNIYIYICRNRSYILYLDLPKGAEWMIRGAYTPSFRIKQHPLEDAGIYNLVVNTGCLKQLLQHPYMKATIKNKSSDQIHPNLSKSQQPHGPVGPY